MNSEKIYTQLSPKIQIKFYLAVFCTFAPMWAIAATGFGDRRSLDEIIFYFFSAGAIAVGWAYAFTQNKKWLFLVIPLQFSIGVIHQMIWNSSFASITFTGFAAMASIVMGYILFVIFINNEGKDRLRLQTEIDLAKQLHEHLVPPVALSLDWVDVYGASYPCSEVGGDLVDGIVRDGAAGLFVADVSGHGMKAGVMMSMVKSAIHMKLLHAPPDETLCADLNRIIHRMKRPEMFVTMACLYVDKMRSVRYVLAGHPPILHYSHAGRSIAELTAQKPGLGLLKDMAYPVHNLSAVPGDIFLLLTDGIFETMNAAGKELGLETVKQIVTDNADLGPEKLAELIMTKVRAQGVREDDQTLMVVKIR